MVSREGVMSEKWKINKDGTATFKTKENGDITIDVDNFFTSERKDNVLGVGFWDDDISDINTGHEKYHEYGELFDLGISTKEIDLKTIQNGLAVYPTPFGPVFAGPGFVEQTSSNPNIVTNYTSSDHSFYPGIVQRSIVVKNGGYHIRTVGIGIGILPRLNEEFSGELWGFTDERLKNWVDRVKSNNGIHMVPTYPKKIDYSGKDIYRENIEINEFNKPQIQRKIHPRKNILDGPEEVFGSDTNMQKRMSEEVEQKKMLSSRNLAEQEDPGNDNNQSGILNSLHVNPLLHPSIR